MCGTTVSMQLVSASKFTLQLLARLLRPSPPPLFPVFALHRGVALTQACRVSCVLPQRGIILPSFLSAFRAGPVLVVSVLSSASPLAYSLSCQPATVLLCHFVGPSPASHFSFRPSPGVPRALRAPESYIPPSSLRVNSWLPS